MLRFAVGFAALAHRRSTRRPGAGPHRYHRARHDPGYPAAGARGHRDPNSRAAEPGAFRRGRAGPEGDPAGPADRGHRRGAEQPARRRRRQPVQLLARPADLHSRLRQPLELRGARSQDPARRHPPDPARRAEPAHQRGFADLDRAEVLRGASSSLYGNASGGVDLVPDQRADPGPFATADPGAGGQRGAGRTTTSTSGRAGPRADRGTPAARCPSPSSRPTGSGSTAPASSGCSTPGSTMPSAGRRWARCGLVWPTTPRRRTRGP